MPNVFSHLVLRNFSRARRKEALPKNNTQKKLQKINSTVTQDSSIFSFIGYGAANTSKQKVMVDFTKEV
jgi:hypothetical protein